MSGNSNEHSPFGSDADGIVVLLDEQLTPHSLFCFGTCGFPFGNTVVDCVLTFVVDLIPIAQCGAASE